MGSFNLSVFITKDLISGKDVNPITVITFLIISFLWMILFPKRMSRTIEKRLNHQINEGDNSGLLGKHSITFSEDKIIAILPESEYQLNWNGIKKVVKTSDYYFLYNSAISAIIIPKLQIELSLAELDSILEKKLNHSPHETPKASNN